jgi:hypothetical protein
VAPRQFGRHDEYRLQMLVTLLGNRPALFFALWRKETLCPEDHGAMATEVKNALT